MDSLTAERMWSIPRVGAASVGGDTIVVPVTTYGDDGPTTDLHRVDLDGSTTKLTAGNASKPAVSPDGSTVAFLRKIDGRNQIHLLPLAGGEARAVTDLPLGVLGCRWMPDGSGLVVVAMVYRDHPTIEATTEHRDALAARTASFHVTESPIYRYWDMWLTDGEVPHLFLVHIDTAEVTDLTPESVSWMAFANTDDPVASVDISPDGSTIARTAYRWVEGGEVRMTLQLIDVANRSEQSLAEETEGHAHRPRFSPDGNSILYGRQENPHFYADRTRLILRDLKTGTEQTVAATWDRSPSEWEWLSDGTIALIAEDDARQAVWHLDPTDESPTALTDSGTSGGLAIHAEGQVVTRSSITSPPELWLVGDDSRRLSTFTAESMEGVTMPDVTDVRFEGADGDQVQMFVVTPPGLDLPAPTVHMIHGGPHGAFGDTWHWRWNAAVVAGSDRAVALVNFHGSTSWGQDFTASIRGEYGRLPAEDVDRATDRLIADGIADPERIAITGGSYGGYMVAWLVGTTDRYACAIAHAAVTNLTGMYGSDITQGRGDTYGAEIWDDRAQVERWSPHTNAAGYATPTLVIHGERDFRVPLTQGLEFYNVLRAKGVEARLLYFPTENHWILDRDNSLIWYEEFDAWLRRFIQ